MLMIRNQILRRAQRGTTGRRLLMSDQSGFAAIIIAIILVIVLSLVTVGFAALMRQEQRSALDRQLSDAAYYAAESGINDATAAVKAGYTKVKTKCDTSDVDMSMNGHQYLLNPAVDASVNSSYTCLLINSNPSTLEYSSVPVAEPTTVVITGADANGNDQAISKLVFSWQDATGGKVFAPYDACSTAPGFAFPPMNCWVRGGQAVTGILRVSLASLSSVNRDSLRSTTYTAFLYPMGVAGATDINALPSSSYSGNTGTAAGVTVGGNCNVGNTPRYCGVAVTNLGQLTYLLHLSSIYRATAVTVTAFDNNGNQMYIKGAQTLIDSTGKAQDVLKRIQVRLPSRSDFDYPEFDIATGGNICKQLATYPPNLATDTPGNTTLGSCTGL